ncbi:MAG: TlyA family RNA methyltransferase [bacterium]
MLNYNQKLKPITKGGSKNPFGSSLRKGGEESFLKKGGSRVRLDVEIVNRNLAKSRQRAQALISAGLVLVDGKKAIKADQKVSEENKIEIKGKDIPYVGRGGLKLEKALKEFKIDVRNKIAVDIGASTGGFTDCLLQNGAQKVYAVDCGYGQLDWKLRNDPRVVVMEKVNARELEKYFGEKTPLNPPLQKGEEKTPSIQSDTSPNSFSQRRGDEEINLIVIDVSFISLKMILPVAKKILSEAGGEVVALIKPQFEVGKGEVGKGGIVRDEEKRKKVVEDISNFSKELGFGIIGLTESPITGADGNVEYLIYLKIKN